MSSWLTTLQDTLSAAMPTPRPRFTPFVPNRVDADPSLIHYHDPLQGPPPPTHTNTTLLPLRTLVPCNPLDTIHSLQTHALYEEIHSVPAAAVGETSYFEDLGTGAGGGHWCVVHPLDVVKVRNLGTKVLDEVRVWIEGSSSSKSEGGKSGQGKEVYVGEHPHVQMFREKRRETLEAVRKELERRGALGQIDGLDGYLGDEAWDDLAVEEGEGEFATVRVEVVEERGVSRSMARRSRSSTMTEEGLAKADMLALKMVREAKATEKRERRGH